MRNPQRARALSPERRRRSRYHVAIKLAKRSDSYPRRGAGDNFSDSEAAGCAAGCAGGTSRTWAAGGTCATSGGCSASSPSPAGGTCATSSGCSACSPSPASGRATRRRAARRAASTESGCSQGHIRAARGATGAPRCATAARASVRCAGRRGAEGTNSCHSGTRETATPRSRSGTPTPRGRAAAGSVRPCGAGKSAWPGVATAQHQQGGGGSHLAQRGLCQQTRQRRAQCARAGTIDIPRAVLRSRMAAASVAADRHRLARTHVLAVCVR